MKGLNNETLANLKAKLQAQATQQPQSSGAKAPGKKQKRLNDLDPGPVPNSLEVLLKEGKHPKTGERQWQGFYAHGNERLRVICNAHARQLSHDGELWIVQVTNLGVPGMIFGRAWAILATQQLVDQDEAEVVIADLWCHRYRGYGGGLTVEWRAEAELLDGEVRVSITVPEGSAIPQLGETWRVKRTNRNWRPGDTYQAESVELVSDPAARRIPTGDFVVNFPDHDNNGMPLVYQDWELDAEAWPTGHYRCHFSHLRDGVMQVEVLGFAAETTEAWITEHLVTGVYVAVGFDEYEAEGYDDFGSYGRLVSYKCLPQTHGVELTLTLEGRGGGHKQVTVENAKLIGQALIGSSELSNNQRELWRCYIQTN